MIYGPPRGGALSYMLAPSGGDDTAAFQAALAALPTLTIFATPPAGGASATFRYGTIVLSSGTYQVGASADIGNLGPFVSVIGPGHTACQINYYGSGSCLSAHSTIKPTDDTFDDLEAFAGEWNGFTVDGTNAGATAKLLDVGDLEGMALGPDLWVQDATGASAWGVYFNNQVAWTESIYGRVVVKNCTNLVGFDVTGGDTSFEYNDLTFKLYCWPSQNGVTLNHGANYANGSLKVRANCLAGVSSNTGALFVFGGSTGPNNRIAYCRWDVQAEVNGSGTHFHQTMNMTTAFYSLVSNTGVMVFGNSGWVSSNINTAFPMQYDGNITGDPVLEGLNGPGVYPWAANGLQGWSLDLAGQSSSGAAANNGGALVVSKVMVPRSIYIQKLGTSVTAAASGVTPNENFLVAYSSGGTLLAQTAAGAIDTALTATGDLLQAVVTPVEVKGGPGVWIYIGIICNASGAPSLVRGNSGTSSSDNIGVSAGTYRFARDAGTHTSPPASVTPSSISTTGFPFFFCAA